jgi:hypothetical protein
MGTDSMSAGYVQLLETELPGMRLEHLTSAIDMSISLPETVVCSSEVITGYTEWVGRWHEQGVSIGWDWAFIEERIVLIHPDEIRSNVQVLGTNGVPVSASRARMKLAAWLETLPWRDGAVRELVQRNRRPPR